MAEAALAAPEELIEHHGMDRRMLTFFGVMAAFFLAALDQTIVATAMPTIIRELNGFSRLTWVTTVYLLTSTAIVPVVGKISEQLGRKRVFLFGIAVFLLGSALSGAAPSMDALIAFRGFQGFGAGILSGTALAVIADLFSPAERGKYTGMITGMFGIASVIGPLVGGWLTTSVSWRAVFYVNLPIGAVVFVGLLLAFPALKKDGDHPRIDYLGALGLGLGAAMMVLGASLVATNSWSYPPVPMLIGAGALLILVTMFHEGRTDAAVIPPQLFTSSIFSLSLAVSFITGVAMFGVIIYIPFFLQYVAGADATNSGLLLLPLMVALVIASIVGGLLISRTGRYRLQALIAFVLMTAGMYLMTLLQVSSSQAEVARGMVLIGAGLGLGMPIFNVIAQNAVPQRFMSSATSAMQFIRQMGGVLGLAVLGALFSQTYATQVAADVPGSVFARIPGGGGAALRSLMVSNPQAFFQAMGQMALSPRVKAAIAHDPSLLGQIHATMATVVGGVKLALTQSVVEMFVIAIMLSALAAFLTVFIKEIPLRSYRPAPAREAAGGSAGPRPAPEPIAEPALF